MTTEKEQYRVVFQKAARNRQLTPEDRAKQEEEQKHKKEERRQREGEIRALFTQHDKIDDRIRYRPIEPDFSDYLKESMQNVVKFWEDPHIKKIYNISTQLDFLLSIFSDFEDDDRYEGWLRWNFGHPFYNGCVINYDFIATHAVDDSYGVSRFLEDVLGFHESVIISKADILGRIEDEDLTELENLGFVKARAFKDLLDKNSLYRNFVRSAEDLIYFINPLFVTEKNLLRLDTYDVWRDTLENHQLFKDDWKYIVESSPTMIHLLDELVRTRKIYLQETTNN